MYVRTYTQSPFNCMPLQSKFMDTEHHAANGVRSTCTCTTASHRTLYEFAIDKHVQAEIQKYCCVEIVLTAVTLTQSTRALCCVRSNLIQVCAFLHPYMKYIKSQHQSHTAHARVHTKHTVDENILWNNMCGEHQRHSLAAWDNGCLLVCNNLQQLYSS